MYKPHGFSPGAKPGHQTPPVSVALRNTWVPRGLQFWVTLDPVAPRRNANPRSLRQRRRRHPGEGNLKRNLGLTDYLDVRSPHRVVGPLPNGHSMLL